MLRNSPAAVLKRQQATAIVAARHYSIEFAVIVVEIVLYQPGAKKIVDRYGERRATMVSKLLVILCGD
ncbi:MAG: hypothetical protein WBG71_08905 [Leeuwenhoekiella sp.]